QDRAMKLANLRRGLQHVNLADRYQGTYCAAAASKLYTGETESPMKLVARMSISLLGITGFSVTGFAYSDSLEMTCPQAKAYVAKNDTAILATGNEYASFTSPNCTGGIPAYVRTKNARYCFVGLYCDAITFTPNAGYYQGTAER